MKSFEHAVAITESEAAGIPILAVASVAFLGSA